MQRGHTLLELLVAIGIAATLATVVGPGVAWVEGRAAVAADARSLALVMRRAQARAASSGIPVVVRLQSEGRAYVCEQGAGDTATILDSGRFHGTCATNYPGGAVQFPLWGWPCTLAGVPRAGSFTFACAGASAAVVLQMGGRVRWQ
jgi:prepilin-type N-terminal cleavage/methylation domain-containing protein